MVWNATVAPVPGLDLNLPALVKLDQNSLKLTLNDQVGFIIGFTSVLQRFESPAIYQNNCDTVPENSSEKSLNIYIIFRHFSVAEKHFFSCTFR